MKRGFLFDRKDSFDMSQSVYERSEVIRALNLFVGKGGIAEIRIMNAFGVKGRNDSGYFDNFAQAAGALQQYAMSPKNPGIYFVLNPFDAELMARASNRFQERANDTTQDVDIKSRRWFFIDCDPKRKTGISSTEAEWEAAKVKAEAVREWLASELSFPMPVLCSSGNGFHLHYQIDLPADDESRDMVKNCLRALAAKFDDDAVTIDTKVFNAARICKLYGTMARKGDHTDHRPHRMSQILEAPEQLECVSVFSLLELSQMAPPEKVRTPAPAAKKERKAGKTPADRARAYLSKVPGAIAGQSGHDWTYHAAALLVIDFGLQIEEALPIFQEWNETCQPPWSDSELMHKLESVDGLPDERGAALKTNRQKWEEEQEAKQEAIRAKAPKPEEPGAAVPEPAKLDPLAYDRKILKDIGIVYCCETESMDIEVFSSVFRKFSVIRDPGKLTYAKLLQIAGPLASKLVSENSADEGKTYNMGTVRNALAIVAGGGKRGSEKLGAGIWRLNDAVMIVNGDHAAIFDGKSLRKIDSAVYEDNVFDLGSHEHWFDFDQVAGWINRDDREWIYSAILELCGILEQWCFKIADPDENPQICAEILASLIVASLIQSFWIFRPMVFLLGESNCGKSTLIQLLCGEESNPLDSGLIGSLAIHSSNQSAAGIRQMAEKSSRPVFVDEFEKGKHRTEILELLRGASRGSQSIRGTAGQKAVTTKLAFMAWAASTESGLVKQVDQNRWIQIQMVPPESAKMGKLKLPTVEETDALRNKLVAAAIVIGNDARALVDALMTARPRNTEHRICQIFAVPAAVFATMTGMPEEVAIENYKRMLNTYDHGQVEKDQDTTLEIILTSPIRMNGGEKSLLSLLRVADSSYAGDSIQCEEVLATHGIRVYEKFENGQAAKYLFMVHRTISRTLLKGSSLEGVKIDDLLLRLPGAQRAVQKISGKPMRGVLVPFALCIPEDEPDLFTEV